MLIHGVWKNDELFQILQEFESENEMIEYEVIEDEENVRVLNRRPVYEGGYAYDELKETYVRHGVGNEIDMNSGVARSECEWVNGEVKERVELFGGWYVKGREEDSLRAVAVEAWTVDVHNEMEWMSLCNDVKEIVVSSHCCNEESMKVLDLGELKELRRMIIGDECFMSVGEVKLDELSGLTSVVIGENCFTRKKNGFGEDPNRHFYLKNCPKLKELTIGRYSFSDYTVCEIGGNNALEVIEIGSMTQRSSNFNCSSFRLTRSSLFGVLQVDTPALKTLRIGYGAFCRCYYVVIEGGFFSSPS